MTSLWERIRRHTVWHPMNVSKFDDERWSVRVWFPLYDLLAIMAGLFAYSVGSPFLNRLFETSTVHTASVIFTIAGVLALIGVSFPRLWRVEIVGKIVLLFLLTSYAFLVMAFPREGGLSNVFVTTVLVMATWSIYPRLTRLFLHGRRLHASRVKQGDDR